MEEVWSSGDLKPWFGQPPHHCCKKAAKKQRNHDCPSQKNTLF